MAVGEALGWGWKIPIYPDDLGKLMHTWLDLLENLALREGIDHASMFEEIVGSSEALRRVLRQVAKVAPMEATVLLLGETGTGKELMARAIHRRSNRATQAFIRVNCAAIPPSLIASELWFKTRQGD